MKTRGLFSSSVGQRAPFIRFNPGTHPVSYHGDFKAPNLKRSPLCDMGKFGVQA
uniref:Uncharacterized protein n=1 Tax=Anguilla anguilla TaxID=7936 RepID=A0A0E9WDF7_ANGAN